MKVAVAGLAIAVAGCGPAVESPPAPQDNVAEPAPTAKQTPLDDPRLDREELLLAVAQAASAAASGAELKPGQNGRRFRFAFRFGCGGPSKDGRRSWTYDEEAQALRVRFDPRLQDGMAALLEPPEDVEAVAGFTVERPWVLVPACPLAPIAKVASDGREIGVGVASVDKAEAPAEAVSQGGRVALAQLFTEEDSRVGRPPETYRAVKPMLPEEVPSEGLDLVIEGRLRATGSGQVIRCRAASASQRPDCVVSVRIDRARMVDPARGVTIAEWGGQ